jgi:hypothetical protein
MVLACQCEARCAAWSDGFHFEQAFYGRVVKDVVFKGFPVLGDGAFLVRLHHVAEDIVKGLRVEYRNGKRIAYEVQDV